VIERIDDMPTGTVGVRACGSLTREDYGDVLEPILREAVDSGEVRMLFVLTDFEGLEPAAWPADIKTGLVLGFGHHSAWKRLAFVTDVEWVGKAMHTFAWLVPGELMTCELDQLEEAKNWVAA
jgi:hypothetical protein